MWLNFIEETMPFIEQQRINIDKLLELWKERFGADVDAIIDYKKYEDYFFCSSDSETDEYILMGPRKKYTDNGCKEIDIDLYIAVEKFQFSKVRELLEKGANPDANLLSIDDRDLDYEDPCNCLDRIGRECSYLCTCEILALIRIPLSTSWYINLPIYDKDIGDLIGWAAHEDMYDLLEQYDKTEEI